MLHSAATLVKCLVKSTAAAMYVSRLSKAIKYAHNGKENVKFRPSIDRCIIKLNSTLLSKLHESNFNEVVSEVCHNYVYKCWDVHQIDWLACTDSHIAT